MSDFDPQLAHYVNAVFGWLELGNMREACAELESVPEKYANHSDLLETRWILLAREANWPAALEVGERLVAVAPQHPESWLHRAYAVRRIPGGGVQRAAELLRPSFEKFPLESTIPFNLACYACQLGNLDEARSWLKHASERSDALLIKKMALGDQDLEMLWPEIQVW